MNDAEYLFKETEKERKRVGYGAKNKKRGGGRYVRTPSDNLSKKERAAMNGGVKTWKEKPFYTWEEFKNLPDDVKIKWLNSIMNEYDVGIQNIGMAAFGLAKSSLYARAQKWGILQYLNVRKGGDAAQRAEKAKRFEMAVAEYRSGDTGPISPDEPLRIYRQEKKAREEENAALPVSEEAVDALAEKNEVNNIATILAALIGTGAKITIELTL